MRNQVQVLVGSALLVFGLMLLVGVVLEVDVGLFCWPVGLILLGIWLLVRPRLLRPNAGLHVTLFGPVRRRGAWKMTDEEVWMVIGDVRLDATEAEMPPGETVFRVLGFIGDVRLTVPESVAVMVSSTSLITEARLFGQKRQGILSPVRLSSAGYEEAERRIHLQTVCIVSDVKVQHSLPTP